MDDETIDLNVGAKIVADLKQRLIDNGSLVGYATASYPDGKNQVDVSLHRWQENLWELQLMVREDAQGKLSLATELKEHIIKAVGWKKQKYGGLVER